MNSRLSRVPLSLIRRSHQILCSHSRLAAKATVPCSSGDMCVSSSVSSLTSRTRRDWSKKLRSCRRIARGSWRSLMNMLSASIVVWKSTALGLRVAATPAIVESTKVHTIPETSIMSEQMRRSPVLSGSISPYL